MSSAPCSRPSGISDRGTDPFLEKKEGWSIRGGVGAAVDHPSTQGSEAVPVTTGARKWSSRMESASRDLNDVEARIKCAADRKELGVSLRCSWLRP